MAVYNKFQTFSGDLGRGAHKLEAASDEIRMYASNAAPSASGDRVKADLAEITPENGYPAGGTNIANDYNEVGGVATLTGVSFTWTAAGGSFGPLRYVAMYNFTNPAFPLISWWDYGSSVTVMDGEVFQVNIGAQIFTLQ